MKTINQMSTEEIRERMGADATTEQAIEMRAVCIHRGLGDATPDGPPDIANEDDPAEITDSEWNAMIEIACAPAMP